MVYDSMDVILLPTFRAPPNSSWMASS